MSDAVGTVRPDDPSGYTMRLAADGTVAMRLNCNRATGTWTAEPAADSTSGRFRFGRLAATRALCPPPSMDEQVAAHAEYVRSYLIEDGRLYLSLMADGGIYVWEPDTSSSPESRSSRTGVPAGPEDGGPRNWRVIADSGTVLLRDRPAHKGAVAGTYEPGTILDNLGCEWAGGDVWCDVQELGGGPRGYVRASVLTPAISPDGSAATGPDDSAVRAGRGEFDATGSVSCAQSADAPVDQCEFGVARAGGGYATVVVTTPDGSERPIFFRMGRAVGAASSEAGGDDGFRAVRQGDVTVVHIGDERYEIPDAVVLGG